MLKKSSLRVKHASCLTATRAGRPTMSSSRQAVSSQVQRPKRRPKHWFRGVWILICEETSSSNAASKVPYAHYSFLQARGLQSLRFDKISFLENSGSLHLPNRRLLDFFVRSYFLFFHPGLPLLVPAEFCSFYHGSSGSNHTISLLFLRALLFAAAEV
jgi:hypothetical protein